MQPPWHRADRSLRHTSTLSAERGQPADVHYRQGPPAVEGFHMETSHRLAPRLSVDESAHFAHPPGWPGRYGATAPRPARCWAGEGLPATSGRPGTALFARRPAAG